MSIIPSAVPAAHYLVSIPSLFQEGVVTTDITIRTHRVGPYYCKNAGILSLFGGAMVVANGLNAQSIAIVTADGCSLTIKNMLRPIDNMLVKLAILGLSTSCGFGADVALAMLPIKPLQFGPLLLGTSIGSLDRDLNRFLAGKQKDGSKLKRSRAMILAVVGTCSATAVLSNSLELPPVITHVALISLSTSAKHLFKKNKSPSLPYISLITTAGVVVGWDLLVKENIIPGQVKFISSIALPFFLKHVMRTLEEYQLGDIDDDDVFPNDAGEERPVVNPWKQYAVTGCTVVVTFASTCLKVTKVLSDSTVALVAAPLIKTSSRLCAGLTLQCQLAASISVATVLGLLLVGGGLYTLSEGPEDAANDFANVTWALGAAIFLQNIKLWQLRKLSQ